MAPVFNFTKEGKRPNYFYNDGRQYISIGFFIDTNNLYGLPERSDSHRLKNTRDTDPYSFINKDRFPHEATDSEYGLYASIPFIMANSVN